MIRNDGRIVVVLIWITSLTLIFFNLLFAICRFFQIIKYVTNINMIDIVVSSQSIFNIKKCLSMNMQHDNISKDNVWQIDVFIKSKVSS